jgi:uncharacterized protein (DUF1330 family)
MSDPRAQKVPRAPIRAKFGDHAVRNRLATVCRAKPPKRIVLFAFENLDRAQAAFASPGYAEAYAHGEKYAKFRIYAVEGLPQQ